MEPEFQTAATRLGKKVNRHKNAKLTAGGREEMVRRGRL